MSTWPRLAYKNTSSLHNYVIHTTRCSIGLNTFAEVHYSGIKIDHFPKLCESVQCHRSTKCKVAHTTYK